MKLKIYEDGKFVKLTTGNLNHIAAEWLESIGSDTGSYATNVYQEKGRVEVTTNTGHVRTYVEVQ